MQRRSLLSLALCAFGIGSSIASAQTTRISLDTLRDRLRGAWAGQMIGVSYGSVYEFQSLNTPILTPLRDWKPSFIDNSIQQDDIYVEMTFLKTLVEKGIHPTAKQAGEDFRDSKYRLWHANMAARTNLRDGIFPPESGHPRYNPHADDIDFQIEADIFGIISPGLFKASNRMCDMFGSIMNYGDGLYGGRFVAGMYCQAYLEKDTSEEAVLRCIKAGMACIPEKSGYYQALSDTLKGYQQNPSEWMKTWQLLQDKYGEVDTCPEGYKQPFNIDAKLNGAYIALGLLYGRGDWDKTLEITTRCGQDADCNPSNAAGVLGALYGFDRIPTKYTSGIPALTGQKFEYTEYDYPGLVKACEEVAIKLITSEGGKVTEVDGKKWLEIPLQQPEPPRTLQQVQDFSQQQLEVWAKQFDARLLKQKIAGISLDKIAPGWKLVACGGDMDPGVRKVLDRDEVLIIHPVDRKTPAVLERKVKLHKLAPKLKLTVTSFPDNPIADWELLVTVDYGEAYRQVIHSPGKWQDIEIDLSKNAGREVTIRIENRAGGDSDWAYEAGYFAKIEVVGK
jgi:hypothetical protein